MKARLAVIAVAALAVGLGSTALAEKSPANCSIDRTTLLSLGPDAFNMGKDGWRAVAKLNGCKRVTAELIDAYIRLHGSEVSVFDLRSLQWHAGQMWAYARNYPRAAYYFSTSHRLLPNSNSEMPDQYGTGYYEEATIAFVRRDHKALLAAQARLDGMPEPSWFEAEVQKFKDKHGGPVPDWPINHEEVDSMVACYDYSYEDAYEYKCPKSRR